MDFEITSAVTALNKALSGGGGKDLNSEEDYSDFSDLSDGDQEQEPVTVAKIKQQTHEKKGKLIMYIYDRCLVLSLGYITLCLTLSPCWH